MNWYLEGIHLAWGKYKLASVLTWKRENKKFLIRKEIKMFDEIYSIVIHFIKKISVQFLDVEKKISVHFSIFFFWFNWPFSDKNCNSFFSHERKTSILLFFNAHLSLQESNFLRLDGSKILLSLPNFCTKQILDKNQLFLISFAIFVSIFYQLGRVQFSSCTWSLDLSSFFFA